ncbi:MAG TPA: cytochrome D1 domain-containing protein [Gammaproteobacteria bacterium]|nr:cytochrome D1 domain-containing protein [Gammaproteobacteria bacterium]
MTTRCTMATPTETCRGLILGLLLVLVPGFSPANPGGQLAEHRYQAPEESAQWDAAAIRASHVLYPLADDVVATSSSKASERFLVVESGDHHASLLDGEAFELIHRWPTRPGLRGSPKFSADGRFVYFLSGEGWVTKYDLQRLAPVAEVRAGSASRNLALSGDGRYLLVANDQPHTLVVLDAHDLGLREVIEVRDEEGRSSRVSAVYDAPARNSFIAALKDIPELWELRYDADAPPVYQGFVHDFRLGEGVPVPGEFPPRRVLLQAPLDDFLFDPDYLYVIGVTGNGQVMAIDLDARRRLAALDVSGLPRPGAGVRWEREGRTLLALPNLREGQVTVIDEARWEVVKSIATQGPGFFLASHESSPYLWGDVFFGPHQDVLHLIDKQSLEIAHTLRPEPGKRAAHVAFSADGKRALVSVWEEEGALVVYDSASLEEIKRIPMSRPTGKYSVISR